MSAKKAKMVKPAPLGKEKDVASITAQMKELVKMNAMIQSKLASLENNLTEAKKREEAEDDFELSEEAVEKNLSQNNDDLPEKVLGEKSDDEEENVEDLAVSQLVDISMEDLEEVTIGEKSPEDILKKAPEDILDRESRELLESESFEDVKDDLIEEKNEIKEEDDNVYLGNQMEEEEEAKFNVKVKEEKVDPSELNMAPGWKVKFGKGRNSDRF